MEDRLSEEAVREIARAAFKEGVRLKDAEALADELEKEYEQEFDDEDRMNLKSELRKLEEQEWAEAHPYQESYTEAWGIWAWA